MLSFDFKNCGFKVDELKRTAEKLISYIDQIKSKAQAGNYDFDESFLILPDDLKAISKIQEFFDERDSTKIAGVIVFGIGGSSLGAEAIYSALENSLSAKRDVFSLDTVDPMKIKKVLGKIESERKLKREFVFVLISKSGKTTETIANFSALISELPNKAEAMRNVVVITDLDSELHKYALKSDLPVFNIPQKVGGRFSVFSAVGLLPLIFAGVDIWKLCEGARDMNKLCLNDKNLGNNPALMSAAANFLSLRRKRSIRNLFSFSPSFENVGKFMRQLIGESLGKNGKGITPLVSIGTMDLHSVGQLYFGGPDDKFTTFINIKNQVEDFDIRMDRNSANLIKGLNGKTLNKVNQIIYEGVKRSYAKQNMPFISIEMDSVSPRTIGALLQFGMMETVYTAKLMGVNAFNQPEVEIYKSEVRKILGGR